MRLLVTGFGPFPTMPRNPSGALAQGVAASPRWRIHGARADALVLTTAYAALPADLDPALARQPDAVLMIGVAGRSKRVRVERRATSLRSTLFPDVAGETAKGLARSGSTAQRRSRVPPVVALRLIRGHGVPSRISHDAGRYLCNASYFRALAWHVPVLFIHVPKPPRLGAARAEARLAAALVDLAISMLRQARVEGRPPLG